MKPISQARGNNREHLAIKELMNTLKEINLNQSWKQQSQKFNRTKVTTLNHQQNNNQTNNLMT